MIPYERQKKILSIIEEKELVKIDELQKIFDGVSVSTLRRDLKETGGTGLGLAIVKHIVELHDARIYLESEVDKGTQIRIVF